MSTSSPLPAPASPSTPSPSSSDSPTSSSSPNDNESSPPLSSSSPPSTTIAPSTSFPSSSSSFFVPDITLALIKEQRYIHRFTILLLEAIVPWISPSYDTNASSIPTAATFAPSPPPPSPSNNTSTTTTLVENAIKPEVNLLSSLLHLLLLQSWRNNGQTLGLESLNLASFYNPSSTTKNNTIQYKRKTQMLLYAICYTLLPYLLERASKTNGWNDVSSLFTSLFGSSRSSGESTTSDANNNNNMELRGRNRRQYHLQQRDLMLRRARRVQEQEERRQRQREEEENSRNDDRRLEERQTTSATSTGTSIAQPDRHISDAAAILKRVLSQFQKKTWTMLQRISVASSTSFDTAHTLPTNMTNLNAIQQQQHATSPITHRYSRDRITMLIRWIIRLHLSLFYLNGKYPTLTHRIVGSFIGRYGAGNSIIGRGGDNAAAATTETTIVANRPSYKIVGMLVFLQAGAALVKATSHFVIETVYAIQRIRAARRRPARRESMAAVPLEESEECRNENDEERGAYTASIERRVPSSASSTPLGKPLREDEEDEQQQQQQSITDERQNESSLRTSTQCGICMNERIHPAAPLNCGHIFCWKCIHHWVANVRPECPLCRCNSREQDIIALYHYSPN